MSLLGSILVVLCLVAVVFVHRELAPAQAPQTAERWLLGWALKGLGGPLLLWTVINLGIPHFIPPFMPEVESARAKGPGWFSVFSSFVGVGGFVIGSYWCGITLAWMASSAVLRAEKRSEAITIFATWSSFLLPPAIVAMFFLGWLGFGVVATCWFLVVVRKLASWHAETPLPPDYNKALAKLKFGKYSEAEWEVIHELEKYQDDFDGWMLLADLYATRFGDLPAAESVVRDLCNQPNLTPSQISIALQRMADWHLKVGQDPIAARRVLEEICRRIPGSHLDRMAQLRIQGLPTSREALRREREGRTYKLPLVGDVIPKAGKEEPLALDPAQAKARADRCVETLKKNPNDVPSRYEFACILAENLGETDLAMEQVELLLKMWGQPSESVAEWLSRMATWQIRYKQNPDAARALLDRVIRECPQTSRAFEAQARLNVMTAEARMRRARERISLTAVTSSGVPKEPTRHEKGAR